jgi:hypothetical protein
VAGVVSKAGVKADVLVGGVLLLLAIVIVGMGAGHYFVGLVGFLPPTYHSLVVLGKNEIDDSADRLMAYWVIFGLIHFLEHCVLTAFIIAR